MPFDSGKQWPSCMILLATIWFHRATRRHNPAVASTDGIHSQPHSSAMLSQCLRCAARSGCSGSRIIKPTEASPVRRPSPAREVSSRAGASVSPSESAGNKFTNSKNTPQPANSAISVIPSMIAQNPCAPITALPKPPQSLWQWQSLHASHKPDIRYPSHAHAGAEPCRCDRAETCTSHGHMLGLSLAGHHRTFWIAIGIM
jgi:hypothetical protein